MVPSKLDTSAIYFFVASFIHTLSAVPPRYYVSQPILDHSSVVWYLLIWQSAPLAPTHSLLFWVLPHYCFSNRKFHYLTRIRVCSRRFIVMCISHRWIGEDESTTVICRLFNLWWYENSCPFRGIKHIFDGIIDGSGAMSFLRLNFLERNKLLEHTQTQHLPSFHLPRTSNNCDCTYKIKGGRETPHMRG